MTLKLRDYQIQESQTLHELATEMDGTVDSLRRLKLTPQHNALSRQRAIQTRGYLKQKIATLGRYLQAHKLSPTLSQSVLVHINTAARY